MGIDQMFFIEQSTSQLLQFIKVVRDEEIIANSAKIMRILLRDEKVS